MIDMESELLKIGSYYLSKHEMIFHDDKTPPRSTVDRMSLLEELLRKEAEF